MAVQFFKDMERFQEKVLRTESCWLWIASKNKKGYGKFSVGAGRWALAHRWIYQKLVEEIPAGLFIDHLCRTPSCVNPSHLEVVTPAENSRRGALAITHCPHGHPYAGANLYVNPKGQRFCRTCGRARNSACYARRKQTLRERAA